MYPSDYGYATSGGNTINRSECLNKVLYNWNTSDVSDCKNNDWLYDNNNTQWTLFPFPNNNYNVFSVNEEGRINADYGAYSANSVRPVVYLNSNITIAGGTGSSTDPFTLR